MNASERIKCNYHARVEMLLSVYSSTNPRTAATHRLYLWRFLAAADVAMPLFWTPTIVVKAVDNWMTLMRRRLVTDASV